MFEKIEKAVFFTITRVFAWLVILPAFLALVYGGYKVATTYVAGHKAVEVTHEDVKTELERKENPWGDPQPPESKKKKDKVDEWKHEAQLQELLNILGGQIDRPKAEEILKGRIMRQEPKDRTHYIKGLISVVNSTPTEKRLQAVDTYESLWGMASVSRDAEEMAAKGERTAQLWLLGAAFGVIALFSLILILLAIEKNTRKA